MQVEIEIPITPRGKPRHRTMRGGRPYPDPKGVKWEQEFAWQVKAAIGRTMTKFDAGTPLRCDVIAYFQRTQDEEKVYKKTGKPKHPTGPLPHTKKPDFDNVAKIVGDALNGFLWQDDQQITAGYIVKAKVPLGEKPHVWLRVSDLTVEQFEAMIHGLKSQHGGER